METHRKRRGEKRRGRAPKTQRKILRDAEIDRDKETQGERDRGGEKAGHTKRCKGSQKIGATIRERKREKTEGKRHTQRDRDSERTETRSATKPERPTHGDGGRGKKRQRETETQRPVKRMQTETGREAPRDENRQTALSTFSLPSPPSLQSRAPGSSWNRRAKGAGGAVC